MAKDDKVDLADTISRLGILLFSEETLQSTLNLTSQLIREALPASKGGGVTLIRRGERYSAAYTDEIVERADSIQYALDEGPCLAAWRTNETYRIDDLETDRRWPRWAEATAKIGIRSAVSTPLRVRGLATGSIKAYSDRTSVYSLGDERTLELLAEHAAIVLANVEGYVEAQVANDQLKDALLTRDTIGQAKGILMEREGIDDDAAFAILRDASQSQNIKLRDVARAIVEITRARAAGKT